MNNQYITKRQLELFGIEISDVDTASLLEHLNDTLKERIGTEIAALLDDTKLKELLTLEETGSEEAVTSWLTMHVPDLPQIIEDEIDILMGELADGADTINETTAS